MKIVFVYLKVRFIMQQQNCIFVLTFCKQLACPAWRLVESSQFLAVGYEAVLSYYNRGTQVP